MATQARIGSNNIMQINAYYPTDGFAVGASAGSYSLSNSETNPTTWNYSGEVFTVRSMSSFSATFQVSIPNTQYKYIHVRGRIDYTAQGGSWREEPFTNTYEILQPSFTTPQTISATLDGDITITWGTATAKNIDLKGYILEQSIDGSAYTEIYKGTATTFAMPMPDGTNAVYRVKAYGTLVALGTTYTYHGDYKTGDTLMLIPPATPLAKQELGSIVKVKENGVLQDFYVAKHDYSTAGRTLLIRRYVYDQRRWHSADVNAYATSEIDSWLNLTYFATLDTEIQDAITAVTIKYTPGNGNWALSNLQRKVFLLSRTEIGIAKSSGNLNTNIEGETLQIYNTLKIAKGSNGTDVIQWTRTPYKHSSILNVYVAASGIGGSSEGYSATKNSTPFLYSRPCFTLPSTVYVNTDGEIVLSADPPSITTPSSIHFMIVGATSSEVDIVWGASTATNIELGGYILEQSINNGDYTEIYRGKARAHTTTLTQPINSVAYRVKAYGMFEDIPLYSQYTTANTYHFNDPPKISGADTYLGTFYDGCTYEYAITDKENHATHVTERIDSTDIRTFDTVLGEKNTFVLDGDTWASLAVGQHTITIIAVDSVGSIATRMLTFTKDVNRLSVTYKEPQTSTEKPTRITIIPKGQFPAGAIYKAYATNNFNDREPIWEDCTYAVYSRLAHVFRNKHKTSKEWCVNFMLEIQKGDSLPTEPCVLSGALIDWE